jgi:hypothetical protein
MRQSFYSMSKRSRADVVAEQLTPKISVKYDAVIPNCRAEVTFSDDSGQHRMKAMCYRLEDAGENIENCEGWLIEVRPIADRQEIGSVRLTWADSPKATTAIRLIKNVRRHLDIVRVTEDNSVIVATENNMWPIDRQDMFKTRGDYVFSIVVYGDGSAAAPPYTFRLTLTDDWQSSYVSVS